MTTQAKSLYDRLGGLDAITAAVDSWVVRVADDDRINRKFERTDIPRLKKEVIDQLCEATGGPCAYTGRSMRIRTPGCRPRLASSMQSCSIWGRRSTSSMSLRRTRTSWLSFLGRCAVTWSRSSRRRRGHRFLTATRLRPL
jgi:hypothetical protein